MWSIEVVKEVGGGSNGGLGGGGAEEDTSLCVRGSGFTYCSRRGARVS